MPPIRISIRLKLILSFALLASSIITIFTLFSYVRTVDALQNETLKRGIDTIKTFNQMAATYIFEEDFITIYDNARELLEHNDILRIRVMDDKMNLWISTDRVPMTLIPPDPFYRQIIKKPRIGHRGLQRDGHRIIEFVSPVIALGKVAYLVTMEISLSTIENQLNEKVRSLIALSGGMIVLSIFLGGYISKKLTDPIQTLVRGTREISQGNLGYRTDVASGDEIGKLSRAFNAMADHLQKELHERKRAELALRRHRDRLEEIVRERTAKLASTNDKLTQEIDGHKRTEEALRKSEERYRRLSEVTLEGIVFHENGIFLDANTAFEKLSGYRREELVGRDIVASLVAPESRGAIRDKIASRYEQPYEIAALRKDGTVFPAEIESRRTQYADAMLGVASIRDLTEKKRLLTRLQRAQKMEVIGTLAGGVAHDLNNILTGIVGYPDLLLYQLPQDSPLRKPIETIRETGMRAADIVQDLLTLARRGVAVRETVNFHDVILAYLKSPEHEKLVADHPGVRIETRLSAHLPHICGSPFHLSKTLMNLFSNAAESMKGKGKISISTENRHFDGSECGYEHITAGDYIVLAVEDNGAGIPQQDIERIFEPFYTRKVMGKSGTGLGLAVVWGTVKDHGGYIDVNSAEGKGAAFTLYFPVTRDAAVPRGACLPVSAFRGSGESVLIVDDIPEQRKIAISILTTLGYDAVAVPSGEDALERLKSRTVDLMLIDMVMESGMDGLDTYRKAIEIRPGQKAVIVSGFSETERVKEALKLGAAGYVKKPYTLEAIGRAVRSELDRCSGKPARITVESGRVSIASGDQCDRPA